MVTLNGPRRASTRALAFGVALALALLGTLAGPPARAEAAFAHSAPELAPTVASPALTPTTVYLPNITRQLGGPTGWQTPFIVQNIASENVDLDISFYSFADGSLVASRHIAALKPGTSFADVPNNDTDLPAGGQFSVVIRSTGQVVSVVIEHQGVGDRAEALSYTGITGGAAKVSLPYVAKQANGWLTTFIIQNLGAAPTTANISMVTQVGGVTVILPLTRLIQPGRSGFVDPRFEPVLITGVEYSATITADQPIAVIANVHNDSPDVTAPQAYSYTGIANAGTTTFLPYAAKNGDGVGRNSTIFVQNAGATPASPDIKFYRFAELIPSASFGTINPIQPGARVKLDLASAAATDLKDGDYSLVLIGGNFAVLNATLTTTTALGFIGTASPSGRLYLPNVTRTLGGSSGWTTPIMLQSAGATAATVKWYRFTDDTLVHTHELGGIIAGSAIRIDPRSIAALTDNTQYAVVIEGTGGSLAAVVFEYAAGGDNAMAYEAFGASVGGP